MIGVVKDMEPQRRFGLIEAGGQEIFFRFSDCLGENLQSGTRVCFEARPTARNGAQQLRRHRKARRAAQGAADAQQERGARRLGQGSGDGVDLRPALG
jgi:cold shock CspA family protein